MLNYVESEKFIEWYRAAAKQPLGDSEVLSRLYADYCDTRSSSFVLPAEDTTSGREEKYDFRVEVIGCCGANTVFIYF